MERDDKAPPVLRQLNFEETVAQLLELVGRRTELIVSSPENVAPVIAVTAVFLGTSPAQAKLSFLADPDKETIFARLGSDCQFRIRRRLFESSIWEEEQAPWRWSLDVLQVGTRIRLSRPSADVADEEIAG